MSSLKTKKISNIRGATIYRGDLGLFDRIPAWILTLVTFVLFLLIWEGVCRLGWVSPLLVPRPTTIGMALSDGLFSRGTYWVHIRSTTLIALCGFVIAGFLGIAVASFLSMSARIEEIIYPYIVAFQTLPKVALAPLIVIWAGFGNTSKLIIVVIVSFFPIFMSTLQGLRVRDRDQYQYLQTLGATRIQILFNLRLPAAAPHIFSGLHIGVLFSLIGAIVAEFVGSDSGLGYVLLLDKSAFNVPGVFAILTLLVVIGTVFNLSHPGRS
jgi:NitT/TauT family transport system permease protein